MPATLTILGCGEKKKKASETSKLWQKLSSKILFGLLYNDVLLSGELGFRYR